MKKYLKLIPLFILAFIVLSASASSQDKFAHVNVDRLLEQMPGRQKAEAELREYTQYLEQQFASMQNELQQKYQEYLDSEGEYSELIRQSKERELQNLQMRITEFQETAQQDLREKEESLLRPIIRDLENAIKKVAEEHNYSYVFDSSGGSLLYAKPGDDIKHLVKKELGLD